MRKIFKTLACLIMSLLMSMTFLGGCNLVSVDNKRDMNQVVATVKISEDVPEAEKIYKKDIVMAYLNYGYYYEYQGQSRADVIDFIVTQLISNRVYVQNAILKFDTNQGIYAGHIQDATKDKWDIKKYLTAEEITDAEYLTYKDMNDFIDNYVEDNEDKFNDTLSATVRTVPKDAANEEKELDNGKKLTYIEKGIDVSGDRRKAYNEVVEVLEINELLGDDYNGDLTTTTYFKETLKNYQETKLLEKFEKCITNSVITDLTIADLQEQYQRKYEEQENMSAADFAEKLSSATSGDPVLVCSNNGTYGYVYNLLLGASEEQTAEIGEIKFGKKSTEYANARRAILEDTIVKDLRSTWLLSGYDFDLNTGCFTGDYTFAKKASNSLPFKGIVKHLNPSEVNEDDYAARYSVLHEEKFTLDEFIEMMETYLYGSVQAGVSSSNPSVYKKVNIADAVEEYDAKINELLFAFSTDDGSLNTYKGYSSEPKPDAGKNETYMQEFADAAREILGQGADGNVITAMGNNSYIMVATDYGYHVMFYSQVFDKNYNYASLVDYLSKFYTVSKGVTANDWEAELAKMCAEWDDWKDTKSYLYQLVSSVISASMSNELSYVQNEILNENVYGSNGAVVKYEDRYADLMKA
ncbi:MAG: hypothetical protein IKB30_04030 [Clostridia bacterium]|nr:hypothetical protein [Clostridia bacterium]